MSIWLYAILSVLLVSLISLIGVFTLSLKKESLQKMLLFFVSFAIGGLFGDAFIHLIPEAFAKTNSQLNTSLYIVLGIIIFFILERFLRWRHCHMSESEGHHHPVVFLNLIGDAIHNFLDGMIIGASYLVSVPVGISTTLAVILHEIPQEIGEFSILLHGGLSIKKALMFNFLSALTAIIGTICSLSLGAYIGNYTNILLPVTAGGFIYIAGSCLLPDIQHRCEIRISTSFYQLLLIIIGVGIMAFLSILK